MNTRVAKLRQINIASSENIQKIKILFGTGSPGFLILLPVAPGEGFDHIFINRLCKTTLICQIPENVCRKI